MHTKSVLNTMENILSLMIRNGCILIFVNVCSENEWLNTQIERERADYNHFSKL